MIYGSPMPEDRLDQGDLVDDCPILSVGDYDLDARRPPRIDVQEGRVLVLTQTCDLANSKALFAAVATVLDARTLVESGILKASDVRGPIRAGRVYGWYFLPASVEHGLPEMIVDLRQLHTIRLDMFADLCRRGRRRARLQTPYREHLAKHFSDTYSRIGLPEPFETQ